MGPDASRVSSRLVVGMEAGRLHGVAWVPERMQREAVLVRVGYALWPLCSHKQVSDTLKQGLSLSDIASEVHTGAFDYLQVPVQLSSPRFGSTLAERM